jgi:SAM-dependent methyltransferase
VDLLVTVGMSARPFDRLLNAVAPVCARHHVFAQTGTSTVRLPCAQAPFVPYPELLERIHAADIVVTHAGNTVRLVQRAGKVPIVVARTAAAGEMPNDHQVEFLRHEERTGRVVAVWNPAKIEAAVEAHPAAERRLLRQRPLPQCANAARVAQLLDSLWQAELGNPFARHHLRRYAYAWSELCSRRGRHLDVGCGRGEFLGALAETTELGCHGVDPNEDYLSACRRSYPAVPVGHVPPGAPLPFPEGSFDSASLLDVLEHVPSEDALLSELARVLAPGGLLVVTVPRRHVFSALDPDNAKFRAPRIHRLVYSARFGGEVYRDRFVDRSNGLFGDLSIGKREHTNYRPEWLIERLSAHGFELERVSGANLLWRWFQVPALLLGGGTARALERLIYFDGEAFRGANLFLTARKAT